MDTNNSLIKTLYNLDLAAGTSGDETEVAEVLAKEMEGLFDEFVSDAQGNQIYTRYGEDRNETILFTAHMDELGFIISYIDENGFAKIIGVGYHDDRMAVNQRLVFRTSEGKKISGITGSKPAHIMTEEDHLKVIPIEDLFVDFGTDSVEETLALGLNIGDYGTFDYKGELINGGKHFLGKSVDDRSGLATLVEMMRRIKDKNIQPNVVIAGTVQEEVGMRGGGPVAQSVSPDIMFAVDVTLTGGTPGIEWSQAANKFGGGVSFNYFDWDPALGMTGNNTPRKVTERQIAIAKKHNIPFQRGVIKGGGTDAWSAFMSGKGVMCGGINIPSRYIHTAVSTIHLDDLEWTTEFLVHYVEDYEHID